MDTSLILMGLFMLLLLVLSAFASATEMAITSINKIRLKLHAEEGNKKAISILKLLENYNLTITSIVVFNNIINITLPTISTLFFSLLISNNQSLAVFISTVVMTILIIFLGEIIPKIYGKEYNEKHMYASVGMLKIIINILYVITIVFLTITNFTQKKLFPNKENNSVDVEEEILTMIEEGVEDGTLEESEEELIRNAIEFNEIRVEEILQPKAKIVMINVTENPDNIFELMNKERYSRIPVYEDNTDNIIGILNERDFLTSYIENSYVDVKSILREANFIPDTMRISILLPKLQKDRTHMTMVVDERGTIQGLITVEDILEELVGEIWDEHDDVEKIYVKINEREYSVNGQMPIGDFNELFEELPNVISDQENTIAGYLLELFQAIPQEGSKISDEWFDFEIEKMDGNRIEIIIVYAKEIDGI